MISLFYERQADQIKLVLIFNGIINLLTEHFYVCVIHMTHHRNIFYCQIFCTESLYTTFPSPYSDSSSSPVTIYFLHYRRSLPSLKLYKWQLWQISIYHHSPNPIVSFIFVWERMSFRHQHSNLYLGEELVWSHSIDFFFFNK